jgi:hypothetical protein
MGSIKLTPFVLFLILLLVLVVAMIFGYKSNMVVEGNTSSSAIWSSSQTDTYTKYSPTAIDAIYESTDGSTKILFDPVTKNIIVPTAGGYSQYTRDSKGTVSQVTATADADSAPTASTSNGDTPAPWSTAMDALNILYSPLETATVVIIIKPATETNEVDKILAIFRNDDEGSHTVTLSSPDTGLSANTDSSSLYTTPSSNTFEKITLRGDETQVLKMVPGVFWSKTSGICAQTGSSSYDISTDYKTGLSKQITNKNVLVITLMVTIESESRILANIITRNTSAPIYKISSVGFNGDIMDTNITTFFVKSSSPGSGSGSGSGSDDSDFEDRLLNILSKFESGSTSPQASTKCDDPRYMLKTEVIPPVCPACPACPASSGCNLSINSNGEIVDCNGKKYTPDELYKAAGAPATWAGAAAETADSIGDVAETGLKETGDVLGKTVDAAGNTITKTADTAGNLVTTTVDTAGNIVNKTVGTAADLASELASGIGKGISDTGSGLKDLVTDAGSGAKDLVTDAGSGAKDLVTGAGAGLMELSENQKRMYEQQQQQQGYSQQQQGYPQQQQGYPQQQQQQQQQGNYYGYQQPVYSNYQSCSGNGSNYMPITNDFSQFS